MNSAGKPRGKAAAHAGAHVPKKRLSLRQLLGESLLTLAAIGGLICIILVILATVFGISLIMFGTGSMSPTIPADSVAVVHEVPASDVRIGQIVTLSRPGKLPVTHRVTSVTHVNGEVYSITMRGDANKVDDPAPYVVERARIVLSSTPGLAPAIVTVSTPGVMGSMSLLVGVLVTWAYWPRVRSVPTVRTTANVTRNPIV